MAESSLTAAYKDLLGDVGSFLGYGRGAENGEAAFDSLQTPSVTRCVKGGLRKFYFCGYDWSFLKPAVSLTLPDGQSTLALPDDFGGVEGRVACALGGTESWGPLPVVGEGQVRELQARWSGATGRPECVAVQPLRGTGVTQGQRFQLAAYPEADQDYTLGFQYYLNPDYLSGAFPYAYGGPQHAETLLEGCLSVAELVLDDSSGVHAAEFMRLLEVSKEIDRRVKPQTLGYNGDRSDGSWMDDGPRHWRESGVTFGGVLYG